MNIIKKYLILLAMALGFVGTTTPAGTWIKDGTSWAISRLMGTHTINAVPKTIDIPADVSGQKESAPVKQVKTQPAPQKTVAVDNEDNENRCFDVAIANLDLLPENPNPRAAGSTSAATTTRDFNAERTTTQKELDRIRTINTPKPANTNPNIDQKHTAAVTAAVKAAVIPAAPAEEELVEFAWKPVDVTPEQPVKVEAQTVDSLAVQMFSTPVITQAPKPAAQVTQLKVVTPITIPAIPAPQTLDSLAAQMFTVQAPVIKQQTITPVKIQQEQELDRLAATMFAKSPNKAALPNQPITAQSAVSKKIKKKIGSAARVVAPVKAQPVSAHIQAAAIRSKSLSNVVKNSNSAKRQSWSMQAIIEWVFKSALALKDYAFGSDEKATTTAPKKVTMVARKIRKKIAITKPKTAERAAHTKKTNKRIINRWSHVPLGTPGDQTVYPTHV